MRKVMIAWDAFYTYLLKPLTNIKLIIATVLIASLYLRRTKLIDTWYHHVKALSVARLLPFILITAFLLRLIWILWSPHVPPAAITEDASIWRHANELASGGGYRDPSGTFTTWRPVGYPFFLSLLIRVFGPNMFFVELVQALMGVLVVFCIYLLGVQLKSKHFGAVAALVFACYPTAIMFTKLIADEHLFILLWLIGIILLIWDLHKPSYKKVVSAGLVLGISAIVRTYSVITPAATLVTWLFSGRGILRSLERCAILGVLMFMCAVPWAIRNYIRLGYPVLYTSLFGKALYQANNPTSDVRYPVNPTMEQGCDPVFCGGGMSEVEWDFAGRRAALKWIKKNPGTFLQKTFGRIFYMLGLTEDEWVIYDNFHTLRAGARRPPESFLNFLERIEKYAYATIFCLSGLAVLVLLARATNGECEKGWIYVLMVILFYIVVTGLTLAHRKYRLSIEPFFCLMALYGIYHAFFGYVTQSGAALRNSTSASSKLRVVRRSQFST